MRFGYGARTSHYSAILNRGPLAPCVEVITENFLERGGRPRAVLERIRQDAEVLIHGVGLSLGSTAPLSEAYLDGLWKLAEDFSPGVVSDHVCFGSVHGFYGHDLWPLPYTEETITHLVERIDQVQTRLRRRFAIENVSSYVSYQSSAMPEWDFVSEIVKRADCDLLLDVNNVYVSAHNHGFSATQYLATVPLDRVTQIHLAGHEQADGYLLDNHGSVVCDDVLDLFWLITSKTPHARVIVEWDENLPAFDQLLDEVRRIESATAKVLTAA